MKVLFWNLPQFNKQRGTFMWKYYFYTKNIVDFFQWYFEILISHKFSFCKIMSDSSNNGKLISAMAVSTADEMVKTLNPMKRNQPLHQLRYVHFVIVRPLIFHTFFISNFLLLLFENNVYDQAFSQSIWYSFFFKCCCWSICMFYLRWTLTSLKSSIV